MNRRLCLLLALALLGASPAPTPLVTGSVRDQSGRPIGGATVRARTTDGSIVTATSSPDGTFALSGAITGQVEIRCRYCRTTTAQIAADGTVVAVVQRYDALAFQAPTADDIAALPYNRIESDLALHPYIALENSSNALPGPQVSDHVIQRGGGLIIDAGIPNYDIASGLSPLLEIPSRYKQRADILPQSDAYRYGDLADNGTFILDPQSEGSDATVAAGNGALVRAGTVSSGFNASAGYSGDNMLQASSADAGWQSALLDGTFAISATASDGRSISVGDGYVDSGFAGATASYERTQAFTQRYDVYADRGSYAAQYIRKPLSSSWSDMGGTVTLESNAAVAPFALLGIRTSAGTYDATMLAVPLIAATMTQAQQIFGLHASGATYDIVAAAGGYDIAYAGGSYGTSMQTTAFAASPLVRVRFAPARHWSFDISTSGSFRQPTFAAQYGEETPLPLLLDRDATQEATVGYSDNARLSADVTALVRNTSGFDNGRLTSLGGSVTWQVAPALSLRSWWMHVTPSLTQYTPALQFGASPRSANVGSVWLTYENASHLRIDAIWRQDLLDYHPDAHLDGSVSGPLASQVRWFVGSERYLNVRHLEAGLRFASP